MTRDQLDQLCLAGSASLRDARAALNRSGRGVLLVCDSAGRLRRTVTDGDLRRAALERQADHMPLAALPAQTPRTLGLDATLPAAVALMDRHQIDHLPIVDAAGRPADLVLRRELSQRIWLSSPHLGEEETAFVEDAFRTNWIAPLGPHVDGFEAEVARVAGFGHGAAVSSGTAAIHLGLLLLGVRPGDTVFCSSLTFVGSCNPILYCSARPVFIDSEPQSWNMSPPALERAFEWARREGRMPRCVVVVNLYGQSADMDALLPICKRYGVPVLEDAAESLGAMYKGRPSGGFGALGVFSFNGNKIITTSGGGMLVAQDAALMARARKLATQAREPAAYYEHVEVGFNYRMSNVLAGIGRGQLKVLVERVTQRRRVFERYRAALADLTRTLDWMPEPTGSISTRWLTCFTLRGDRGEGRDRVLRLLERHAIEARPVWKPMHLQPLFDGAPYFAHKACADALDGHATARPLAAGDVAASLFAAGICLPSGSNLSDAEIDRVIGALRHALSLLEPASVAV